MFRDSFLEKQNGSGKKMPCSKETLALFFYTLSNSSLLFLLFFYFSSTLLLRFINFVGSYPIIPRCQNGYDYTMFTDEEEEADNNETCFYVESTEQEHLVADVIHGSESLVFFSNNKNNHRNTIESKETTILEEEASEIEDTGADDFESEKQFSILASASSESGHDYEEDMQTTDVDLVHDSPKNRACPTSTVTLHGNGLMDCDNNYKDCSGLENKSKMKESNFSRDENFYIFASTKVESRQLPVEVKDEEEIFGDSCTVGSTSKSSSEWRSSIKDSGTEDPFSSSSRRSCPRWESYTVFQKYDEEMMFLDRISAQKLQETESLRSIQVCPRSISDRIVHKFANISKNPSDIRHNPYHELESAYVAQICITWEALNCNYSNFQRKGASQQHNDFDPGCPARIAQQFQQFQVLLQRYVENEPYEQGRRPEVYARMRLLAPKLLLVPEYRDSEDDQKDEGFGSRISSGAFLLIMEEGIRTFMNFLKADKEKACRILAAFFKRNRKRSVDPALLQLMKKVNKKKQTKLKDLRRAGKCLRRRKLKVEEEMEILMALIDLKLVSRVLRMADLSEQQLHWCEEKMSKVSILDGKLQRDSSPLFFPAH